MPRSVNSVAAKARRKKILKLAKVISEEEKMYIQQLKMLQKKVFSTLIEIEDKKRETLEPYGFKELMQVQDYTA